MVFPQALTQVVGGRARSYNMLVLHGFFTQLQAFGVRWRYFTKCTFYLVMFRKLTQTRYRNLCFRCFMLNWCEVERRFRDVLGVTRIRPRGYSARAVRGSPGFSSVHTVFQKRGSKHQNDVIVGHAAYLARGINGRKKGAVCRNVWNFSMCRALPRTSGAY